MFQYSIKRVHLLTVVLNQNVFFILRFDSVKAKRLFRGPIICRHICRFHVRCRFVINRLIMKRRHVKGQLS
jgi:hypothetical protein